MHAPKLVGPRSFSILLALFLAWPQLHSCHRSPEQVKAENEKAALRQQQLHHDDFPPPPLEPLRPPKSQHIKKSRSFTIDYKHNTFLKDGRPFQYVSGSIHYFRVPPSEWRDRLLKARYGGLNAVQTYIEWASHEPQEQVYDFSGMLNFTEYCRIAQELGLSVILRLGPFIASERDNMGLPYWLSANHTNMKYRTSDSWFMFYVQRWYKVLLPRLVPLLYENGGPVIMGQVENEYGSYGSDTVYLVWLRDLYRSYFGPDFLLFTVDGASENLVENGRIAGVYTTVDFGIGADDVPKEFQIQRLFEPKGPLVNTEFYPGWYDTWGDPHAQDYFNGTIATLEAMLKLNASVNIYMYHGGTSFGFMNGALTKPSMFNLGEELRAMVTSYDYRAPITDVGELTPKYYAIRKVIKKYCPNISPELSLTDSEVAEKIRLLNNDNASNEVDHIWNDSPLGDKRKINITLTATLYQDLFQVLKSIRPVEALYPLTFEQLTVRHGFVYYETQVPFRPSDPIQLDLNKHLHDRAHVFVNNIYRATLSRMDIIYSTPLSDLRHNDSLGLLVENQGHTCCTDHPEQKGIIGNVTLGSLVLTHWRHYKLFPNWSEAINSDAVLGRAVNQVPSQVSLPFTTPRHADHQFLQDCKCEQRDTLRVPSFYIARFTLRKLPKNDLFLNVGSCGHKGVAFLNGFNLGRYWPVMGPQVTLYIPKATLSTKTTNTLVLFELDRDAHSCLTVYLTDEHVINGTTPYNYLVEYNLRNKEAKKSKLPQQKQLGVPLGFRPGN